MVTMQSGFTDIFSSEKSSRSIQCRDVFISSMHGLRWQREVIKPRGHLVSLTTAKVGNWVTESFRFCFLGQLNFFVSDDRCP